MLLYSPHNVKELRNLTYEALGQRRIARRDIWSYFNTSTHVLAPTWEEKEHTVTTAE